MKKFIIKLLIYLLPLLLVLGVYLYKDPFKVVYHYDPYFAPVDSSYYDYDDAYISTQSLLQSNKKYNQDSYIFGSSRSGNFLITEWTKYIHSDRCFHCIAYHESLYGVDKKIQFIDDQKYAFKNALVCVDHELLGVITGGKGHLHTEHPLLSGQNRFHFQTEFLQDYFDKQFLPAYLTNIFTGNVSNDIFHKEVFHYIAATNEWIHDSFEANIDMDSVKYYAEKKNVFYKRDTVLHYSKAVIGEKQMEMLQHIKSIFDKNHTAYKIVINPLYDQEQLNTADLEKLQAVFGKENVFDFSGINEYTNNINNYYETNHFRIRVGTSIMSRIYQQSPATP